MNLKTLLIVLMIGCAAMITLIGCEKKEPAVTQDHSDHTGMADGMMMDHAMAVVDDTIAQKTCPVMDGNPIDPEVFIEYQGKKVYFCCADCKEKFLENPEEYIAKLPQFQE